MSSKQSGAQRRKMGREAEAAHEVLLSKVPKLTSFFMPTSSSSVALPNDELHCNSTNNVESHHSKNFSTNKQDAQDNPLTAKHETTHTFEVDDVLTDCESESITSSSERQLSNDPSTWPEHLSVRERDIIAMMEPIPFLANDKEYPRIDKRHFSNEFQYRIAENGERIKRRWLVYSRTADAAFCLPCRLFEPSIQSFFGKKEGFNKWRKFCERAKSHETSPGHFLNTQKWIDAEKRLKGDKAIDQQLIDQINVETERWKSILKRVISVIMFLAENNIAFRGSSTKLFTKNNGSFLGLIQLLGQFDPTMKEHLRQIEAKEQRVQMLSVKIQNEIINLLAQHVKEDIIKKIHSAKYFSVIMDCTPDVSHKEQTSLTIRYVHEENETNGEIVVQESFIGYTVAEESTGEALSNLLNQEIESCGLDLKNCRGQGYDNGANMAGIQKGVQARILSNYPLAFYTPCGCHSLNLVVSDGAKTSVKSTLLFGVLQRIYTIFAGSPKRWCIVSEHVQGFTLKQVCETRWEARINSVSAVLYQYGSVIKSLEQLSEDSNDATISSEGKSLQIHMEDFSFLVCLVIWHDLLFQINIVSKTLQNKSADIALATNQLKACTDFVKQFRESGLNDSIAKAKEIAKDLDIDSTFQTKRPRMKKNMFSYESKDEYNPTPEDMFKRDVFLPLVDTMLTSLKDRMDKFSIHKSKWGFLFDLKHLPEKKELEELCISLQDHLTVNNVSDINGKDLYNELSHVNALTNETPNEKQMSPLEALRIIKKTDRRDLFTNLWISLRILLTIPVSVATCERSFSKLKLIKTYLRSSMMQERLSSLAILAIENEVTKQLNMDDIIANFAKMKARRIPI